jgi:putative redox protein
MQYKFEKPVHGTIGNEKYQCTIEWRNGKLIADEAVTSGGKDTGPDPYTLLLSSLASCTLITMRMYIDRKGWNVPDIAVNVNMYQETKDERVITIIDRDIVFLTPLEEEQKTRLYEIANHCPISKILEGEIKVRSFLFKDGQTQKKIKYANDEITVVWKPEFCQHSGRCWSQLPEVFDFKKKKWIEPHGASLEKIIEQVKKCPSGALSYYFNNEAENNSSQKQSNL